MKKLDQKPHPGFVWSLYRQNFSSDATDQNPYKIRLSWDLCRITYHDHYMIKICRSFKLTTQQLPSKSKDETVLKQYLILKQISRETQGLCCERL